MARRATVTPAARPSAARGGLGAGRAGSGALWVRVLRRAGALPVLRGCGRGPPRAGEASGRARSVAAERSGGQSPWKAGHAPRPGHAGSLPDGRGAVRAQPSRDFARQSAQRRRIPLVLSPPRHGEAHTRSHEARAAPRRGAKPSPTVPQSPPARRRARPAPHWAELPA